MSLLSDSGQLSDSLIPSPPASSGSVGSEGEQSEPERATSPLPTNSESSTRSMLLPTLEQLAAFSVARDSTPRTWQAGARHANNHNAPLSNLRSAALRRPPRILYKPKTPSSRARMPDSTKSCEELS